LPKHWGLFETAVGDRPAFPTHAMYIGSWAATLLLSLGALAQVNTSTSSPQQIPSAFRPPQHWQNNNLVRSINLEKSYPREYVNIVIENISPAPQDEYYIPFEGDRVGKIGSLEVKDKKSAGSKPFVVESLGSDALRCAFSVFKEFVERNSDKVQFYPILPRSPTQTPWSFGTTNTHHLIRSFVSSPATSSLHQPSRQAIPHLHLQCLPPHRL